MSPKLLLFGFAMLICVSACEKSQTGLDRLFPGPGFEKGWSWDGMPTHYTPDNLYEYIDGEAELYLTYGFRELATQTYFWGSADDTSFVVDIYDMGSPLNGFGLFSNYRQPGYHYESIGTEAIVSDYGLRFFQGRYVVEIKTGNISDRLNKAVRTVAERISERIPDPPDLPSSLNLLPAEEQIDKTLRYISKEMLNQGFLPGGLEAKYLTGEEEIAGFVVLFDSPEEAKIGLNRLRTFYQDMNASFVASPDVIGEGFAVRSSYHGYVLVSQTGRYLAGVQDLSSPEKGRSLLSRIVGGLPQE